MKDLNVLSDDLLEVLNSKLALIKELLNLEQSFRFFGMQKYDADWFNYREEVVEIFQLITSDDRIMSHVYYNVYNRGGIYFITIRVSLDPVYRREKYCFSNMEVRLL